MNVSLSESFLFHLLINNYLIHHSSTSSSSLTWQTFGKKKKIITVEIISTYISQAKQNQTYKAVSMENFNTWDKKNDLYHHSFCNRS